MYRKYFTNLTNFTNLINFTNFTNFTNLTTFLLLTLVSCTASNKQVSDNCAYYWRTTFNLNDKERDFVRDHDIKKMYVHYFDVNSAWGDEGPVAVPEATIKFNDSIPQGVEVVPVVYITTDAIEKMQMREVDYAERILRRVNAMSKHQGIDINEIQLDCDWTKTTRPTFYALCQSMKEMMDSSMTLSSTIRLHQLVQTPPPVDKGVLMVYNTGNIKQLTSKNSIFSIDDIAPYLEDNRLAKYDLPLDIAYPTYGWSVVFRKYGKDYYFDRIMHRTDFTGVPKLMQIGANLYKAMDEVWLSPGGDPNDRVHEDYLIRVERPTAEEILEVKDMIDTQLKGKTHNNIIYHLDDTQLKYYSDDEINKILSGN